MTFVVTYDIKNESRLRQVAKCCENWGYRVQYSVFECRLTTRQSDHFWEEIEGLIDPTEDRVIAYPIHGTMKDKIRTLGVMQTIEKNPIYIY